MMMVEKKKRKKKVIREQFNNLLEIDDSDKSFKNQDLTQMLYTSSSLYEEK